MISLKLMSYAYVTLLCLPHDSEERQRLQRTLCELRDEIARATNKSPEEVQTTHEATASLTQQLLS